MNKQEKLIAALLGALMVGWMVHTQREAAKQAKVQAETRAAASAAGPVEPIVKEAALIAPTSGRGAPPPVVEEPAVSAPETPEEVAELASDDLTIAVSSHGAVIKRATLGRFNTLPGKPGDKNPPVTFDFSGAPALELTGLPGLAPNAAYTVTRDPSGRTVTLTASAAQGFSVIRRIELLNDYRLKVTDTFKNGGDTVLALGTNGVGIGCMAKGASKNEMLSADSLPSVDGAKVRHWGSEKTTKPYLAGSAAGGCRGSAPAVGLPDRVTIPVHEPQTWVAIKSRFFVTAILSSETSCGFTLVAARDLKKETYSLSSLAAHVRYPGRVLNQGDSLTRDYTLFIGPKKLSFLQAMGHELDAVMEFGFFAWFCKLLVPTLNFFHRLIPNYGIAIILLTFLVRIIFWPLTHKSTESMKRMQELQPKLKEIQAKFKDNPQKMQQETWALYRENKVNPMSSCLPMLVQIPVFIALFNVLRSAVELRYAPFLWIADLSEAENLFAGAIPLIGSLNILPILMSATMSLQSYLTPSTGDPQQQRMMMIMMPIMMLFMFYSFPAALSLYWTVSQILSIVQMLLMRRRSALAGGNAGNTATVEPPLTRQQRRQAARKS